MLYLNLMIITLIIVILPFIFSTNELNNNNEHIKMNRNQLISTIHKDDKFKSSLHNTRSSRHHLSRPIPILSFSLNMDSNNYVQVSVSYYFKYNIINIIKSNIVLYIILYLAFT